jgi:hypothetical protein
MNDVYTSFQPTAAKARTRGLTAQEEAQVAAPEEQQKREVAEVEGHQQAEVGVPVTPCMAPANQEGRPITQTALKLGLSMHG